MKIVAFLQCAWFHNPAAVQAAIARQPADRQLEFRQRFLHRALFAGGMTGTRLKAALGMDICGRILWEEASTELGTESSAQFPPNLEHIARVLKEFEPGVVIAFGNVAHDALLALGELDLPHGRMLFAPHPAARYADTAARLAALKEELLFHIEHANQE